MFIRFFFSFERKPTQIVRFVRRSMEQSIGLTLCYGLNDDLTTTVFIQQVKIDPSAIVVRLFSD